MKRPKRLLKRREPEEPVPLAWPPTEHGQRVEFSDGVGGRVLLLLPGMCIVGRDDDGLAYLTLTDTDGIERHQWGGGEPFETIHATVKMLYEGHRRDASPRDAAAATADEFRQALDVGGAETKVVDWSVGPRLALNFPGLILLSAAVDGFDYKDLHDQECVFAEVDRMLRELSA
jgi:hypothetical protein